MSLNGKEVLVVDIHVGTREEIVRIVQRLGGDCIGSVRNGMEALQVLQDGRRPQIIFLEIALPEMDGLELFKTMRQQFPNFNPRIIVFSYLANEAQVVAKFPSTTNFYNKKIGIAALEEALKNSLDSPDQGSIASDAVN